MSCSIWFCFLSSSAALYFRSNLNVTQKQKQDYLQVHFATRLGCTMLTGTPSHSYGNRGTLSQHAIPDAGGVIPLVRHCPIEIAIPIEFFSSEPR